MLIGVVNEGAERGGGNGQRALPDQNRAGYLDIEPKELKKLAREVIRWSRSHPRWCLVDIKTANGVQVYIEL